MAGLIINKGCKQESTFCFLWLIFTIKMKRIFFKKSFSSFYKRTISRSINNYLILIGLHILQSLLGCWHGNCSLQTVMSFSISQTPARKLKDHVSTGHADSPVTFVVGKAHKQKVVLPTGAAPRLVTNTALLKKNMKMDEDLTGNHTFSIPANESTCSL